MNKKITTTILILLIILILNTSLTFAGCYSGAPSTSNTIVDIIDNQFKKCTDNYNDGIITICPENNYVTRMTTTCTQQCSSPQCDPARCAAWKATTCSPTFSNICNVSTIQKNAGTWSCPTCKE